MVEVRFTDIVKDIMKKTGALSVVLVSRDGLTLAGDVPPGVYTETFSIMCATILGAAVTAASEFNKAPPNNIEIQSSDMRMIITGVNKKIILVVVTSIDTDVSRVYSEIEDSVSILRT